MKEDELLPVFNKLRGCRIILKRKIRTTCELSATKNARRIKEEVVLIYVQDLKKIAPGMVLLPNNFLTISLVHIKMTTKKIETLLQRQLIGLVLQKNITTKILKSTITYVACSKYETKPVQNGKENT